MFVADGVRRAVHTVFDLAEIDKVRVGTHALLVKHADDE